MKRILFLSALLISMVVSAQVPQGISYQAIALNGSGNPVVSSNVGIRLSVLDNSASGTVLYAETHTKTTSAQGLFNLVIGQGTPTSGAFSIINWGINLKFLKVEMDATGGTNYVLVGTTQLLSVPYALYAGKVNSENVIGGADDTNASSLSFMTATDAHAFMTSSASSPTLTPYVWFSSPITGTPLMKSYTTFVTSSNVYMLRRVGTNYEWLTTAISGQPLKVYSTATNSSLVITTTHAYIYNHLSLDFVSVDLDGTIVDSSSNAILTTTHAYLYGPDTSQTASSWHSIPISGIPIKAKLGYEGGNNHYLFLTSTNAYLYGPDTTVGGPGSPDVAYSWKTTPLGSTPIID